MWLKRLDTRRIAMNEIHAVIGNGPVGRATAEALAAAGKITRMLSRTGHMIEAPAGVEQLAADIYNRKSLDNALRGAAAVYQCGQPPYSRWATEFPSFQRAILEAAERAGARLVLAENLYGYGDRDGRPIGDESAMAAKDAKGIVRAAMSEEAFAAHRAGRLPVVSARASDFFGPWAWDQSHLGARALRPLSRGKPASMLGSLDQPHTYTYVRDFGTALAILGISGEGYGRAWLVPNDRPTQTQREALAIAAGILAKPLRAKAAGRPALALASLFAPVVRELLPLLYQFEKPYVVASGSFQERFGMGATPFDIAMADTIAWMRARGLASS
jgi:nucleoside-diphosphate-sugar epimerase